MNKKILTILGILILGICIPYTTYAAVFSYTSPQTLSRGEEGLLEVRIDTEGQTINALSGDIQVPEGLDIKTLYDGNSIVTVWVDKPVFDTKTRIISFSGFIPGGVVGRFSIFSFIAKSEVSRRYTISMNHTLVYKNDGKGTLIPSTSQPITLVVNQKVSHETAILKDTTSPEDFTPSIASSKNIYDNQTFVSFLAQDKGLGIDHYEYTYRYIGTPRDSEWVRIESPFLLPKDSLNKKIYIKAVDKAGNIKIAYVLGPSYYTNIVVWSIIIILLFLCALYFKRSLRRPSL